MGRPKTVAAFAALLATSCVTAGPPAVDRTRPTITLTAPRARGGPSFSSDEAAVTLADACAQFRAFPAMVVVTVYDAGGVRSLNVRAAFGRFDPSSISIGPSAPESTWGVRPVGTGESLDVTLAPPESGRVRTGVAAVFEVTSADQSPVPLVVSATDYRGNMANLFQVDVRGGDDPVRCRGE
jgi:hypothetical protein